MEYLILVVATMIVAYGVEGLTDSVLCGTLAAWFTCGIGIVTILVRDGML